MASQGGSVDWFCFWLQDYEDSNPAKQEQYERWRELRKLQEKNERKEKEQKSDGAAESRAPVVIKEVGVGVRPFSRRLFYQCFHGNFPFVKFRLGTLKLHDPLVGPHESSKRVVLAGAVNRNGCPMRYNVDSWRQEPGGEQAFRQVLQAIASFETERNHRSREHDGDPDLRQVSMQVQPVSTIVSVSVGDHDGRLLLQHAGDDPRMSWRRIGYFETIFFMTGTNVQINIGKPQELEVSQSCRRCLRPTGVLGVDLFDRSPVVMR